MPQVTRPEFEPQKMPKTIFFGSYFIFLPHVPFFLELLKVLSGYVRGVHAGVHGARGAHGDVHGALAVQCHGVHGAREAQGDVHGALTR